jgi:hypothetical protein
MESVGIHTSAMLIELSISTWTARKLDKRVSQEIDFDKGTKTRAGNYNKNLMAGTEMLDAIVKYAANVRAWHNKQTLPWSDSGLRLLPMANFMEYKAQLGTLETNYNTLVDRFLTSYPDLVSAAAFTLGTLFDREDYPVVEKVKDKFGFKYFFSPVPVAGDFRVDTHEAALRELHMQYEEEFDRRLQGAMKEAWTRLYECLDHMKDRLSDDGDKPKIFRDSLVSNAKELIEILPKLNITNDPKLEQARVDLSQALMGIDDAKELRDNKTVRQDVRARVDEILNKFDF